MAELLEFEIRRDLQNIGISEDTDNETLVVRVFMHVWAVMDVANRIRELIKGTRGLEKNSLELQIFTRYTNQVENLRNYVQHLHGDLNALSDVSTPSMGQSFMGTY